MLQRACGVRLDKSFQRAEWGRRPLTMAMIAYAARDAQMTYVLYGWLRDHYPWAVDLHEVDADEPPPQAADWLRPFLDGGRGRSVEMAVAEAGLSGRTQTVTADLRAALAVARHPVQRVRLFRIVGELGLKGMADDLRPYLASPASEERASTARSLGRLHDAAARPTLQALTTDPVEDVRVAAHYALDHRVTHATGHSGTGSGGHSGGTGQSGHSGGAGQPIRWTSGDDGDNGGADAAADDWRARLRAQFPQPSAEDGEQDGDDNARASGK